MISVVRIRNRFLRRAVLTIATPVAILAAFLLLTVEAFLYLLDALVEEIEKIGIAAGGTWRK